MSRFFPTSAEMAQHTIFPGVHIQTCAAERMMLSVAEFEPHAVVSEHSHPHEQVGMVLAGRLLFTIGGEQKELGPGDIFRIPGNTPHQAVAGSEPVRVLDIFHPVREEYR